jgi:ubiquinol oxidase
MSTSPNSQLVRWPLPIGPPTLPSHALRVAQAATLAAPRLRYDPFSRLMFFTVNVLYGQPPALAKFLVLEHLARIPYQTWERVAQRAIARTEGRSQLAVRIMDRVVEARAQQDNEQFHLLIIDELLIRRGAAPGRIRYRILPRLLAGPWHAFTWLLHLIRPVWSYRLNASFEDHAEHEYMHFVALHPELDDEPVVCDAADGYGRFDTLGDLLRQIGHDERVHKLESLAAQQRLQPPGGAELELAEPDRDSQAA